MAYTKGGEVRSADSPMADLKISLNSWTMKLKDWPEYTQGLYMRSKQNLETYQNIIGSSLIKT